VEVRGEPFAERTEQDVDAAAGGIRDDQVDGVVGIVRGPRVSRHQAGGNQGRSADGLGCSFSLPKNATPAVRCAAMRRVCGGKFYANYCGGKMLSAM